MKYKPNIHESITNSTTIKLFNHNYRYVASMSFGEFSTPDFDRTPYREFLFYDDNVDNHYHFIADFVSSKDFRLNPKIGKKQFDRIIEDHDYMNFFDNDILLMVTHQNEILNSNVRPDSILWYPITIKND